MSPTEVCDWKELKSKQYNNYGCFAYRYMQEEVSILNTTPTSTKRNNRERRHVNKVSLASSTTCMYVCMYVCFRQSNSALHPKYIYFSLGRNLSLIAFYFSQAKESKKVRHLCEGKIPIFYLIIKRYFVSAV